MESLDKKRKEFIKIPEESLNPKLRSGYYYGEDIKEKVRCLKKEMNKAHCPACATQAIIWRDEAVELDKVIDEIFGEGLV